MAILSWAFKPTWIQAPFLGLSLFLSFYLQKYSYCEVLACFFKVQTQNQSSNLCERERERVGLIILSWQRHRWRVARQWTRRVQRRWLPLREQTWLGYASRTSYGSTLTLWTETWCSITLLSHHSTTGLATTSNSACAPFIHSTSLTSRKLPTFLVFLCTFYPICNCGYVLESWFDWICSFRSFFELFWHMGLLCFLEVLSVCWIKGLRNVMNWDTLIGWVCRIRNLLGFWFLGLWGYVRFLECCPCGCWNWIKGWMKCFIFELFPCSS